MLCLILTIASVCRVIILVYRNRSVTWPKKNFLHHLWRLTTLTSITLPREFLLELSSGRLSISTGWHEFSLPIRISDTILKQFSTRTIQDSRLKNQDSRIKTKESRLKNQDSRLKTQDSRLKVHGSWFMVHGLLWNCVKSSWVEILIGIQLVSNSAKYWILKVRVLRS